MNSVRMVFAQLLSFVPLAHLEHLDDKHQTHRWNGTSPNEVTSSVVSMRNLNGAKVSETWVPELKKSKLHHIGLRHRITRPTLSDTNERRSSKLFESLD